MARNKFDVDEELEEGFNAAHFKRLFRYVTPYKKSIFRTLGVIFIANIASMLGPFSQN